jgi:mannose-1-phosphate guanylyltransferase
VPIRGRPLLDYWLDHLFTSGLLDRILINTHYKAGMVEDYIAKSRWADRVDLIHETELLGTAGTVKAARDYFCNEDFLLAHADNLTTFDVAHFISAHAARPTGCAMTMLSFQTNDPTSCGILELDTSGKVIGFHEKVKNPPSNLANGAVYVLTSEVTNFIASLNRDVIDFSTDIIPHFVGRILAVRNNGYHRDIGTIESLKQANEDARALFELSISA